MANVIDGVEDKIISFKEFQGDEIFWWQRSRSVKALQKGLWKVNGRMKIFMETFCPGAIRQSSDALVEPVGTLGLHSFIAGLRDYRFHFQNWLDQPFPMWASGVLSSEECWDLKVSYLEASMPGKLGKRTKGMRKPLGHETQQVSWSPEGSRPPEQHSPWDPYNPEFVVLPQGLKHLGLLTGSVICKLPTSLSSLLLIVVVFSLMCPFLFLFITYNIHFYMMEPTTLQSLLTWERKEPLISGRLKIHKGAWGGVASREESAWSITFPQTI